MKKKRPKEEMLKTFRPDQKQVIESSTAIVFHEVYMTIPALSKSCARAKRMHFVNAEKQTSAAYLFANAHVHVKIEW